MNKLVSMPKKISIIRLPAAVIQGIVSLIYPPRCQVCGESLHLFNRKILCEICYNSIRSNTPPFCRKCGKPVPYEDYICEDCKTKTYYFDASHAVCIYEGVIRECIHNFKYNANLTLERLFKDLMIGFAEKYIDMHCFNWLVPVPLHRVKYRERTFNQSAILAVQLSKKFKTPMLKNNLLRTRSGKPQMMLPKDKRLEDIKNSFKIKNPSLLKDKSVLLIDDVFTTGATVNECSKVLKEAGARLVEVLTLAISV